MIGIECLRADKRIIELSRGRIIAPTGVWVLSKKRCNLVWVLSSDLDDKARTHGLIFPIVQFEYGVNGLALFEESHLDSLKNPIYGRRASVGAICLGKLEEFENE